MIKQIATEGGVTVVGELFSDALSKPDGPAATYVAMFTNNVSKIAAAMKKKYEISLTSDVQEISREYHG